MKGLINKEQRRLLAAVLVLHKLSTTNPSLDLFVQFKMFGNGITVDAFKHKFSQPTHVEWIY